MEDEAETLETPSGERPPLVDAVNRFNYHRTVGYRNFIFSLPVLSRKKFFERQSFQPFWMLRRVLFSLPATLGTATKTEILLKLMKLYILYFRANGQFTNTCVCIVLLS